MFIDTHTHLYLDEFSPDNGTVVQRAIAAGVEKMVFPNVDLSTIGPMMDLARRHPGNISMAMGLHPTEIKETWEDDLARVISYFSKYPGKFIAVGEIGIDLYWDKSFKFEQMAALQRQFEVAYELGLPAIIHCRDGLAEVLGVLDRGVVPTGVFHSFGGTVEDVIEIRKRGDFYFGINGIVTFKNSRLKDVLPQIGLDRILLETDAPYLAPVPHRGKRNESAYLVHTAAFVAEALGVTIEEVAIATSYNATALFGI